MKNSDEMHDILVEAIIFMLPTEESGRKTGITSGYRPNHNFFGPENTEMRFGEVTFEENAWIQPGETKRAIVHFIIPDGYQIDFQPGLTWLIQEGSHHVGNGTVLFVMD